MCKTSIKSNYKSLKTTVNKDYNHVEIIIEIVLSVKRRVSKVAFYYSLNPELRKKSRTFRHQHNKTQASSDNYVWETIGQWNFQSSILTFLSYSSSTSINRGKYREDGQW